ncbi:hypothetical protein [uncultured Paraglaciecola sp.]|uniref:hypothetical protein n=1 Tax=uncultured Paraglaciecola sp. TaxID=1765024 RepID=UPI0030D89B45|tara:strand:- start:790 stop:1308 length:519 start_codon:yes stop_codon:yes gene_type:complete
MKLTMFLFFLLCLPLGVKAHGFDYSVIVLTETENNLWNLRITSSLDAFRKEVRIHFSDSPYATPEQFKEQLLEHLNSTLKITVRDKNMALDKGKVKDKSIALGQGTVKLGHEASVSFMQIKIPKQASVIQLINGAVKDIYRHSTKLFINVQGEDKKSFILNKSNNFTADFSV